MNKQHLLKICQCVIATGAFLFVAMVLFLLWWAWSPSTIDQHLGDGASLTLIISIVLVCGGVFAGAFVKDEIEAEKKKNGCQKGNDW